MSAKHPEPVKMPVWQIEECATGSLVYHAVVMVKQTLSQIKSVNFEICDRLVTKGDVLR